MSRLVEALPRGARARSGGDGLKGYADRVAKYIPAEILAAYVALLPIVIGNTKSGTTLRTSLLGVILFGLGSLNVPYLVKMANPGQPKWKHISVSSVAYLTWTYSIGGFWTDIGLYQRAVAAILMVFVSILSGLFIPHGK